MRSPRKRDMLRLERMQKKVERIADLQDLLATWEQFGDMELEAAIWKRTVGPSARVYTLAEKDGAPYVTATSSTVLYLSS